jgi:signal transduction histidine kinase
VPDTPIHLLLVEDDESHGYLIQEMLQQARGRQEVRLTWVLTVADAVRELENGKFSAMALDLGLRDSTGLKTLTSLLARAGDVPIVVLTAQADGDVGLQAIQAGAHDYLVKGKFTPEVLMRSLQYAIERKRQSVELERRSRDLQWFAGLAAQDASSPLSQLAQLLKSTERLHATVLKDDVRSVLRGAARRCETLQRQMQDLHQLAGLGGAGTSFRPTPVRDAVEAALKRLLEERKRSGAAIIMEDLPTVTGDLGLLTILFYNLLGNAMKFCRPGTAPEIHVGCVPRDREYVISVDDNGIGIPEEDVQRIFQPGYRVPAHLNYEGAGMGLAMCQRVVERHGGSIRVMSRGRSGTSFQIVLPKKLP